MADDETPPAAPQQSRADARAAARSAQRRLLLEERIGQVKGKIEQTERRLSLQRLLLGEIEHELASLDALAEAEA